MALFCFPLVYLFIYFVPLARQKAEPENRLVWSLNEVTRLFLCRFFVWLPYIRIPIQQVFVED